MGKEEGSGGLFGKEERKERKETEKGRDFRYAVRCVWSFCVCILPIISFVNIKAKNVYILTKEKNTKN